MRQVVLSFEEDGTLVSSKLDGYPGRRGRKIDGKLLAEDLLSTLLAIMNSKDLSYADIGYRKVIQPHIRQALKLVREE